MFQKTVLGYLAHLKVEISKLSDVQQEILQTVFNSNNYSVNFNDLDNDVKYFILVWPTTL